MSHTPKNVIIAALVVTVAALAWINHDTARTNRQLGDAVIGLMRELVDETTRTARLRNTL